MKCTDDCNIVLLNQILKQYRASVAAAKLVHGGMIKCYKSGCAELAAGIALSQNRRLNGTFLNKLSG